MKTAVAMLIFNRPETTKKVFAALAEAKPPRLYVFADGPASAADVGPCERSRAVVQQVNWDCDVQYNFADMNLGLKHQFSTGISQAFAEAGELIVLEDDTLPHPSFFTFCDDMLERYRDDPRVMMVSGSNYLERWKDDRQSYHFSIYGSIWGWASWARAWDLYDAAMTAWGDDAARSGVRELIGDEVTWRFQADRFDNLYNDATDRHCWDPPWVLSRLVHGGLTTVPAVNLVTNLGNTGDRGLPAQHPLACLTRHELGLPYIEPSEVAADSDYDRRHVHKILDYWDELARRRVTDQIRARSMRRRVARKLHRATRLVGRGR
jgi:hypothetical protein